MTVCFVLAKCKNQVVLQVHFVLLALHKRHFICCKTHCLFNNSRMSPVHAAGRTCLRGTVELYLVILIRVSQQYEVYVWWSLTPVLTSTFALLSVCVCVCVCVCVSVSVCVCVCVCVCGHTQHTSACLYYRAIWLFWQSVSLWII